MLPIPETYALCLRVRRLASATSTSRTGTPARCGQRAQRRRPARRRRAAEAVEDRLEQSGATKTSRSTSSAAPTAATSGHHDGNSRIEPSSATITAPVSTTPTAKPFSRSAAQPPNRLRREAPAALAQEAAPERERQPHDLDHGQHEQREEERLGPPRPRRRGEKPVAEPTECEESRHSCRHRDVCGEGEVERTVVRAGAGHLVGSEENRGIHRIRNRG